jgi:hypothetical protein
MANLGEKIISFIFSPNFVGWFLLVKIAFIVTGLVLFAVVVFFLLRTKFLNYLFIYDIFEFLTFRPFGVKKIEKDWNKIMTRLDTGLESEYKLAVIEADNMMDETLKRMGYDGDTLGERLKKLTAATLTNIEELEEAHKTRNNIIHDPDYRLSLDQARKTLSIYEKSFRDLDAF